MAKYTLIFLGIVALAGGAYFYMNYALEVQRGADGKVQAVVIVPQAGKAGGSVSPASRSGCPPIRIATLNVDRLDERKLGNPRVSEILVGLCSRFDLLALQDLRAGSRGVLMRLVDEINAGGRQYDFAVCPTLQRNAVQQYSAFLFDKTRIDIDRATVQCVNDPQRRFQHAPLVALFRAKGPAESEAMTFKLINVYIEPERAVDELPLLGDLFRAVRGDGSSEDDVIMLGDFGAETDRAGQLGRLANLTWAVVGTPTTFSAGRPVDNIFFDRQATPEFTGRADVVDVMREFNLTAIEARQVSEHLPVWAEFSAYEGGEAGYIKERPAPVK